MLLIISSEYELKAYETDFETRRRCVSIRDCAQLKGEMESYQIRAVLEMIQAEDTKQILKQLARKSSAREKQLDSNYTEKKKLDTVG